MESNVVYLLVPKPLLRRLPSNSRVDTRHAMPPLLQAYCEDLLLIAHTLPQFLDYAEAIERYFTDMVMAFNLRKGAYTTTARISSIMVQ